MTEEEAADRQEASSIRYSIGVRVARLTSGWWALWSEDLACLELAETEGLLSRLEALAALELQRHLAFWEEAERRAAAWRAGESPSGAKATKTLEDMGL